MVQPQVARILVNVPGFNQTTGWPQPVFRVSVAKKRRPELGALPVNKGVQTLLDPFALRLVDDIHIVGLQSV